MAIGYWFPLLVILLLGAGSFIGGFVRAAITDLRASHRRRTEEAWRQAIERTIREEN